MSHSNNNNNKMEVETTFLLNGKLKQKFIDSSTDSTTPSTPLPKKTKTEKTEEKTTSTPKPQFNAKSKSSSTSSSKPKSKSTTSSTTSSTPTLTPADITDITQFLSKEYKLNKSVIQRLVNFATKDDISNYDAIYIKTTRKGFPNIQYSKVSVVISSTPDSEMRDLDSEMRDLEILDWGNIDLKNAESKDASLKTKPCVIIEMPRRALNEDYKKAKKAFGSFFDCLRKLIVQAKYICVCVTDLGPLSYGYGALLPTMFSSPFLKSLNIHKKTFTSSKTMSDDVFAMITSHVKSVTSLTVETSISIDSASSLYDLCYKLRDKVKRVKLVYWGHVGFNRNSAPINSLLNGPEMKELCDLSISSYMAPDRNDNKPIKDSFHLLSSYIQNHLKTGKVNPKLKNTHFVFSNIEMATEEKEKYVRDFYPNIGRVICRLLNLDIDNRGHTVLGMCRALTSQKTLKRLIIDHQSAIFDNDEYDTLCSLKACSGLEEFRLNSDIRELNDLVALKLVKAHPMFYNWIMLNKKNNKEFMGLIGAMNLESTIKGGLLEKNNKHTSCSVATSLLNNYLFDYHVIGEIKKFLIAY